MSDLSTAFNLLAANSPVVDQYLPITNGTGLLMAPVNEPEKPVETVVNKPKNKKKIQWVRKCKYPEYSHNYYFKLPVTKVKEYINILGNPSYIDYNKYGKAIWDKQTLSKTKYNFLESITLSDSHECYNTPCKHLGNITIVYKINIPEYKLINLMKSVVSEDIVYDNGKKEIIIRGNNLYYCLSILRIICGYNNNEYRFRTIYYNKLFENNTSYNYLENYANRKQLLNYFK